MAKSTARHKRERAAVIAEASDTSVENMRRASVVMRTFIDGDQALMSGDYSVNELYKLAKGDNRVGLHILVHPELREKIKAAAKAQGYKTVNDMLAELLTKIFW